MRFKVLNDGRLLDTLVGKKFNPRSSNNREWAATLTKQGNPELTDILKRIDKSEQSRPQPTQQRMAGEVDVESLIKSLKDDIDTDDRMIDMVGDARQYLGNRRVDLDQLGLIKSDGSLGEASEALAMLELGRLKGNVPMPIIEALANGGELRKHTNYEINPVTGEEQIVAVMDPNDRRVPLQTTFGVTPAQAGRGDVLQADELVIENALKLQGNQNVTMMPFKTIGSKGTEIFPADFRVTTAEGNVRNVDAEQFEAGSEFLDIPSHTAVAGHNKFASVQGTEELLQREINRGKNIFSVVNNLVGSGMIQKQGRVPISTTGKLARAQTDVSMDPEERYHSTMRPVYSPAVRNKPFNQQPRKVVTAPQSFMENNLELIVKGIKEGKIGKEVEVRRNSGGDGRGRAFHKVLPEVAVNAQVDGQPVATNPMDVSPLMAQLLDKQSMQMLLQK